MFKEVRPALLSTRREEVCFGLLAVLGGMAGAYGSIYCGHVFANALTRQPCQPRFGACGRAVAAGGGARARAFCCFWWAWRCRSFCRCAWVATRAAGSGAAC